MVIEPLGTQFTLHNSFIGVHLEHSTVICTVVSHSVLLLCFVKQEHIGNPVGTELHCDAPKVSFKHAAGRSGIAVYL
jgi:hypothetical protein